MASGGMRYMMPYQTSSAASAFQPRDRLLLAFPDKRLARMWAVEFLHWHLLQLSWRRADRAVLSYCRRLHLLSEPQMWRLIIRSCECQFYGQMQTEIQHQFGVWLSNICDSLQPHF